MKSPMKKMPTIHQRQLVAKSRLFHIETLDLEFSNGEQRQYERLMNRGHGAVLIVPMLDDTTVLLIREYAAGTEQYELALPKGKMEQGEDMFSAANREIMEEVGYEAAQFTLLKTITLAPNYLSHCTHLILAQQLSPHREMGDEPEVLDVVPWSLNRLPELVQQADCTEARSLLALYLAQDYLQTS